MADTHRRPFRGRSFTAFLLTLTFVRMAVNGIVLYLGPPGGTARRTGWSLWGLGRDGWMAQHITSCAVFVVAALAHVWLNRRVLWSYVHARVRRGLNRRRELFAAAALTAFLVAGTIWNLSPWKWMLSGSRHLSVYREEARAFEQGGHGKGLRRGEGAGRHRGRGGER